jgi:hypothetical protein
MQVPVAQMRAQIAGQKYETENNAKAIGLLSQTLGITPAQVESKLQAGNISQAELGKLAQVYPVIAQLSPKVGEIVKGVFSMQKDIGAQALEGQKFGLSQQQFALEGQKFEAEQQQRRIQNAAADRTAGMSQADLVAKYGSGILQLMPGGGMPMTPSATGAMPPPAAGAMPPPAASAVPPPAAGAMPPSAAGAMPPSAAGAMPPSAAGAMPPSAAGAMPPSAAGAIPPSAAGAMPPSAAGAIPPVANRPPASGLLDDMLKDPKVAMLWNAYVDAAKRSMTPTTDTQTTQALYRDLQSAGSALRQFGLPVPITPTEAAKVVQLYEQTLTGATPSRSQFGPAATAPAATAPAATAPAATAPAATAPAATAQPPAQVRPQPAAAASDLANLPLAAQAEVAKRRAEEADKPWNQKRDEILSFTPQMLEGSNTNLRQLDFFARTKPQIFGLMQQQGVLSGLMTAAQEGAQMTAGDANVRLSLPVRQFLEKVKLSPQDQQAVRDVTRILGVEFLANVKANKGLLGVNPTDNDARLLQAPMASVDDSARAMQFWARNQILLNKQREAMYGALSQYSDRVGTTGSPRQFFSPNSEYARINKEYAQFRQQLFRQFNPQR